MIKFKKLTALFLSAIMFLCCFSVQINAASEKLPSINAKATKNNILTLMREYNPNIYSFLKDESNNSSFMFWWHDLYGDMDIGVHENYHRYTIDFNKMRMKCGNGKEFIIDFSNIKLFKSSIMAEKIPENMRTFRFDMYVSKKSEISSNDKGALGLLNEFSAYYWGLSAACSLKEHYKKYDKNGICWEYYINSLGNDMNAYSEFRYWLLLYMNYAEKNYPSVYESLLHNKEFCNTYSYTDYYFDKLISDNLNGLTELNNYLSSKNMSIVFSDSFLGIKNNGWTRGNHISDYTKLKKEMEKKTFVEMDRKIKAASEKPNKNSLISLTAKKSNNRFALSWNAVSDITKYQIQYSTDGGKTFKSAGTVSAKKTSTSLKLDTGKSYTFRIRSYKTVDGKKYYSEWSKAVTVK